PIYPQYIETAIAKCPGDFSAWQADPSVAPAGGGAVAQYGQNWYPCHLITDGGSASSMYYNTTGDYATCKVPADGSTWYVNIRYISSAPTAPATITGWPNGGTYGCSGSCVGVTSWGPH